MSVKYFIELGIGNEHWLSTELEYPDGSEVRVPGVHRPQRLTRLYLRMWVGYAVVILSRRGLRFMAKRRWAFKLLVGLEGEG